MKANPATSTTEGRETLAQEQTAYEVFHQMHPEAAIEETPKEEPALFDGLIRTGKGIVGTVETKCRFMSYEKLASEYDSEWLIGFDKIDKARRASSYCLGVPFFGLCFLVKDDRLIVWKISDADGNWLVGSGSGEGEVPFDTARLEMQRNVGPGEGTKKRECAFLELEDSVEDSGGENMGAMLW